MVRALTTHSVDCFAKFKTNEINNFMKKLPKQHTTVCPSIQVTSVK